MGELYGKFLCFIGKHKWKVIPGTEGVDYRSKWESYDTAEGICQRCEIKSDIRKERW
jgi:hypothetical protein